MILVILGILAAIGLAILIVKFIPKKLNWLVSVFLLCLAVYLSYLIYNSIMGPIRFNIEKKERYAKVIENLKMIRDAQESHKRVTGRYEKNARKLVLFLDTAQFAITNTRNELIEVNKGTKYQPIMVEVEQKVIDTTGYESVKETLFKGKDYSKMFLVPGTDDKVYFQMNTSYLRKTAEISFPVFEARVDKSVVLKGMDKYLIKQEREAIGGNEVKGPYLSVGSLEEVNSNGNWPPLYDKPAN